MRTQRKKTHSARGLFLLGILIALTLASILASIAFGTYTITMPDITAALHGMVETPGQIAADARFPRTVVAFLAGAALAVSGTTFQAVTRNPLADPGIFGLLAGASLAVVIGIVFLGITGSGPQMLLAVIGASAAAICVYIVGSLGGAASPLKLALAGAAITAALFSIMRAILLPRAEAMDIFRHWQIGDVTSANWHQIAWAAPLLITAFLICWLCAGGLNALALGDDIATGLGYNVSRMRLISSLAGVVLCGVCTALTGPIAFVGLIVPHVCRLLAGTDHRILIPASALMGAILLLLSDTLGRVLVENTEIQVGILTPFLGAPLFIWIVRHYKVREL